MAEKLRYHWLLMRTAIVEKLDRLVSKGIESEAEVVYLLVKVRKLLEVDQRKGDFEALVFHCDWVLHARLSRKTARYYLSLINQMQDDNVTGDMHPEETDELGRLMGALRFKEQLRDALGVEGISSTFCDNQSEWIRFMSLYGEIISDVPLAITDPRNTAETRKARGTPTIPTYIDFVTVQKLDLVSGDHACKGFKLQWNLHFAEEPPHSKMAGWRMCFE